MEKHSPIQGRYPECGAIFMSSSSTKDECFRRGLFGLPSKQGTFVKQVKRGMILFLFEFEKRELHGVFQACSDGSMNIVPTAWRRSGKNFPAQVRVKPIWRCHPLPESEFGDAINTNYWSEWKFNFGLSKAQVWRLLMLFNLRKLKQPHPQSAVRAMRILPYDPHYPGLNLAHSQLVGNFDSVQDFDGQNGIPSVRSEVNPLYAETYVPKLSIEDISKVDFRRSLSDIGPVSSAGMFYCPKASSCPESLSEFGSDGMDGPSSYPLSPSNYPSFLVERGYPIATKETQCQSPCRSHSPDLESVDCHKWKCSDHKISDRMLCSDLQESRSSVFSRLSSNTPGWCLENLGYLDHEETVKDASSVEEVMAMSSETHCSWMEAEKSKLRKRGQCNVEKSRNVKQRSSIKSELEMIQEKSITTSLSPTEDKDDQSSENAVLLDFKRRSELQKVYSDTKEERAGSEGLIVGRCKRRKLIRPNFSEKEISHAYSVNSGLKLQASVDESSFGGNQGKLSLQGAESSHDYEKIDTECFSKYENETIEGSSGGFPIIGDDSGKECLHGYPVNSCLNLQAAVDESSFCEDDNCKKTDVDVDVGMMHCQHGSTTEQLISCNSKQHESPQRKGSRTNMQEPVKFGDNDVSLYNTRETKIDDKQESFVDSVKSGDEHGMESVQVKSDRGSEPELLPMVELYPNINASIQADASAVNNQQGINPEQLQASCNSDNHTSPQEHGSNNNVVESMEFGDNEAIDESVRENRRLWEKLISGLQLLRKEGTTMTSS